MSAAPVIFQELPAGNGRVEMTGIEREHRLKTFQPEQYAQGFANRRIGISNMNKSVSV